MNAKPEALHLALVPVANMSEPNFKPAGWRVVEASNRLREIQLAMPTVADEWSGYPVVRAPRRAPDSLELSLRDWSWEHAPATRKMTLLASEVLHHARVALDYCAYHAVWLEGGVPRADTKFPLVKDSPRWAKARRQALPKISAEHLQWIAEVQPFADVKWSGDLVEFSNRDKHRVAVDVIPVYHCRVDGEKSYGDPLGDPLSISDMQSRIRN